MHTASKVPPFLTEMAPSRSSKHSNFIHMRTKPRRSHHLTNGFPTFQHFTGTNTPEIPPLRKWLLHFQLSNLESIKPEIPPLSKWLLQFPTFDLSSIWSSHQSTGDPTTMLVASPLLTSVL